MSLLINNLKAVLAQSVLNEGLSGKEAMGEARKTISSLLINLLPLASRSRSLKVVLVVLETLYKNVSIELL